MCMRQCACTTPNLPTPARIVRHQRGIVKSAIDCSLGCSCNPTFSKITLGLRVLHGNNGPQTPSTTPTFFEKFHLCGWYGDTCHEVLYMDYSVKTIKPSLTLSIIWVLPLIPPTTFISTTIFMEMNCLHGISCDICSRTAFLCRYTVMSGGYPLPGIPAVKK